ncbi:MAG: glycosyltransferase, partial [Balneola sp.]
ASGTSIFAPNSEDVSEVLSHKKTAYLVKPDDWEEEEKGFRELISDKQLRTLLGKNAKEEMLKNTWENRANEILNFIKRSISA